MQKFTRPLTREIEVGGERLAVTLSEQGIAARIVGSRKPPWEIAWPAVVAYMTNQGPAPAPEQLAQAIESFRKGGPKPSETPAETPPAAAPMPDGEKSPEAAAVAAPAHMEQPAESPRPEHAHAERPMEQTPHSVT